MSGSDRPLARLVAAALALSALALGAPAEGQDNCASCHVGRPEHELQQPVFDQASSAHGAAQMSCADCHGGRPAAKTVRAHDPREGFVARPGPEEVPRVCGGCHSDARRIGDAAERLPTDQQSLYRRSGHGKALARGNGEAATCVSCHGWHRIADETAPTSLMHPDNIASTCGGCHSDPDAMTRSGMPLNQMRRWRRSVHGKAFVEDENDDSPTCNDCHDAHGGITGLDDVAACGRCHEEQQTSFRESPHAEVFGRLGFASCVDCHGSHDVRPVHATLIGAMRNSTCRLCHTEDQALIFATVRRFGELRISADVVARRGREALDGLTPEARESDAAKEVEEAFEAAATVLAHGVHSFDEEEVERAVRLTTEAAERAQALERETRPDGAADSTLLLAALVALALLITILAGWIFWKLR